MFKENIDIILRVKLIHTTFKHTEYKMECIKRCRNRRKRQNLGLKSLALNSLSFARVHVDLRAKKIEDELEKEIQRENVEHRGLISKIRHHGEKLLYTKVAMVIVVILNLLDCTLILSELILEIRYVVGILQTTEDTSTNFIGSMKSIYNQTLKSVTSLEYMYKKLLGASIHWSSSTYANFSQSAEDGILFNSTVSLVDSIKTSPKFVSMDEYKTEHITEEIVAHGFHKASVAILSILVLETFMRLFCLGTRILEKKIEIFAGVIVCISFVLDLAFIRGLTMFKIQEYVFILATLIPWRVVRVVNSLIVAVLGQQHLQLKMVYSQKKEINNQLKKDKKEFKKLQRGVETLLSMCLKEGVEKAKVKDSLALLQSTKKRSLLRKISSQHGMVVSAPPSSIKEETETDLLLEANNGGGNNKKSIFANKFTKNKPIFDLRDDQSETSSAGSSLSDLDQRMPFLNGNGK